MFNNFYLKEQLFLTTQLISSLDLSRNVNDF